MQRRAARRMLEHAHHVAHTREHAQRRARTERRALRTQERGRARVGARGTQARVRVRKLVHDKQARTHALEHRRRARVCERERGADERDEVREWRLGRHVQRGCGAAHRVWDERREVGVGVSVEVHPARDVRGAAAAQEREREQLADALRQWRSRVRERRECHVPRGRRACAHEHAGRRERMWRQRTAARRGVAALKRRKIKSGP